MHTAPSHIAALLVLLLPACADNTPITGADTAQDIGFDLPQDTVVPTCTPNRDGRITADELQPALGIPVSFRVATNAPIDLEGTVRNDGSRLWDWTGDATGDDAFTLLARPLDQQWYADDFAALEAPFVLDFDVDGTTHAIYTHEPDGLYLHGIASAEAEPAGGTTLLIYEEPVLLYVFPLEAGARWVSTGRVRDGLLAGLPYAGRDIYDVAVDATGRMELPDLSFDPALRVRTLVTLQPAVGQSVSQQQVSYLFECFGEVARATGPRGESDPDFDIASELRRLAL